MYVWFLNDIGVKKTSSTFQISNWRWTTYGSICFGNIVPNSL